MNRLQLTPEQIERERGASLYHAAYPATACTNLEQLRGWLQAANAAWWQQQQAQQANHERLCEAASQAVQEERTGKRLLCVGHVEPVTREVVILMDADLDAYRQRPAGCQEWYGAVESEQIGQDFSEQPYLW